ncbi:hypothetical protein GOODEAATRI_002164, partial [Goodea atripinnis]
LYDALTYNRRWTSCIRVSPLHCLDIRVRARFLVVVTGLSIHAGRCAVVGSLSSEWRASSVNQIAGTTRLNHRPTGLTESSDPVCEEAGDRGQDLAGVELEEVRKLQELVRRLEVQNETLRNRGAKTVIPRGANSNVSAANNINKRLTCDQLRLDHSGELSSTDCKLSPSQDNNSSSGEEMSPLPAINRLEDEEERVEEEDLGPCGGFLSLTCRNGGERSQGQSQTPESPSQESYESETLTESDSGVDQTALDEVDVLDLEDECAEVEDEDSW